MVAMKENDRFLVDQMPHHELLHAPGQEDHDAEGQNDRGQRRHLPTKPVNFGAENRVDQMRKRHIAFHYPDKGQGGEKRHHALRVVEDAGGLEDEDEAKRDKRI